VGPESESLRLGRTRMGRRSQVGGGLAGFIGVLVFAATPPAAAHGTPGSTPNGDNPYRKRDRRVCGWHFSRDGIISIKVRRLATGPVLRLRLFFVAIDVCGVLLPDGIINGGSVPNDSKIKSSGRFRPILLDFPSTSEQNLQLIEAGEVFWLHNAPYGQAAGAQL
jgi:hypothetical protein